MVVDGKPPNHHWHALTRKVVVEQVIFAIHNLVVTLISDLLTSKSNQFIFVTNCTQVINLVKLIQAAYKISCSHTFSK